MGDVLVVDFWSFLAIVLAVVLIYRFFKSRTSIKAHGSKIPASKPVPGFPVIGQVNQLWLFPIKSCPGIQVSSAKLGPRGFESDRQLMLVRAADGSGDDEGALSFVSLRNVPRLAEFDVSLDGKAIVVKHKAAGSLRIEPGEGVAGQTLLCRLWDDEVECKPVSEAADKFFSGALGVSLRLVRIGETFNRVLPVDVRDGVARVDTSLADGFPYLMTSTSSLAALSKHMGESVDIRRFRSNIVMKTDAAPFDEDAMAEIKIGEHAVFRNLKVCQRCKVPRLSVEDATEDSRGQPTKALIELKHFHKEDAYFGVNLSHVVGMEVKALRFYFFGTC